MPDENNNSKNDGIRNRINDLRNQVDRLREKIKDISDRKKQSDIPQNDGMAFFSLDPQNTEFVSDAPTEFGGTVDNTKPVVSPDLAEFFLSAGLLLHDALYMPFRKSSGRLTDFFSWVEKARDRMEGQDFSDGERTAFSQWCESVGKTLIEAQNKHGLWLTDDEEDLVLAMTNGDLWENGGDNGANGRFNDL